jgi:FtsZ-interacting cell division protein ZipA
MYAELGDVLYIILLIVFVLSGLFKSRKKRANAQRNTLPEDVYVETEEYKTAEDEIFDDWIPQVEKTAPVTVTPVPKAPVVPKNTKKPAAKMSYETIDDVSKLRLKEQYNNLEMVVSAETEKSDLLKSIHLDSEDDVKRAFVYSEIFNRKYC